jgi:hypothetical protein
MGVRGELVTTQELFCLLKRFTESIFGSVAVVAFTVLTATASPACAQEDREAILSTVQQFFDALAESDTALGRAAVLLEGQYFRLRESGDSLDLSRTPHTQFLRDLAAGGNDFLERMWEPTVLQHGRMAIVWTPYDFHRSGEFSHCGVDVFNLIRTYDGWKIAGIMYTVEPTGCAPSPLGPPHRS